MKAFLSTVMSDLSMESIKEFVTVVKRYIDDALVDDIKVLPQESPTKIDYNKAGVELIAPHGGWISRSELERYNQKMTEAIANEKWTEGFILAMQIVAMVK